MITFVADQSHLHDKYFEGGLFTTITLFCFVFL